MKLAECRLGTLVCIRPDFMHDDDKGDVIGHVVGLKKVTYGSVVPQRHPGKSLLPIEIRGPAKWEGFNETVPLIQFSDRDYPVVFDHRELDLFTEY